MKTKRDNYTSLCVSKRVKDRMLELRCDGLLGYSKIIEYLLVRANFLDKKDADFNYDLIDKIINRRNIK